MSYIPPIFKSYTDEDYLRSAIETANWRRGKLVVECLPGIRIIELGESIS